MDDLTQRLREDAARIDASISPELERRIAASLEGVQPRKMKVVKQRLPLTWASSLTGLAAAAAVIVYLNVRSPAPEAPAASAAAEPFEIPRIDLKAEAAMLTSPLREELQHLQSDLEKARATVQEDVEELL